MTTNTIIMTSIARRLDAGTYLPHLAPPVGARSAVPARAEAPAATPIEDTIGGAILGALAGLALTILAALVSS